MGNDKRVTVEAVGIAVVNIGGIGDHVRFAPDAKIDDGLAREIGARYAERVEPLTDSRGSADYRRRVVAVEVRRALETISAGADGEVRG